MKKKFREITIDGDDSWAWAVQFHHSYFRSSELVIWKDKKRVYSKSVLDEDFGIHKSYPVTPGLVSRFIKRFLLERSK